MKNKKLLKLVAITAIVVTTLGIGSSVYASDVKNTSVATSAAVSQSQSSNRTIKRLGGKDRFDTAIEVSNEFIKSNKELDLIDWEFAYPDTANKKVDTIILCNAFDYPDALSAAPLTHMYNAPILLTEKDKLNSKTEAQIKKLGIKNVVIVGGDGVVSNNVVKKLNSLGIKVERIGGVDRYQTSLLIAKKVFNHKPTNTLHFVSGHNFTDALSVAPLSAQYMQPMLLVPQGTNKSLSNVPGLKEFVEYCEKNHSDKDKPGFALWKYNYGSKNDLSEIIEKELNHASRTGYTTSAFLNNLQINNRKLFDGDFGSANDVIFTSGKNFPDALTSVALAGKINSMIIYEGTVGENINELSQKYFDGRKFLNDFTAKFRDSVTRVYYIGGESIVPNGAEKKLNGQL